jgi:hypothetical protein
VNSCSIRTFWSRLFVLNAVLRTQWSIGSGASRLNISVPLALEYEEVLKRMDTFRDDITAASIDEFLDYVFRVSNLVPFVLTGRPLLR